MKTAVFEYTHKTLVDSSLAQAVYYNAENQTMAVQFHEKYHQTGSAIYGEVPQSFYEGFVTVNSLGGIYNGYVKHTFPNVSEGTVYDVDYVDVNKPQVTETTKMRYLVQGYTRVTGTFDATDRLDAMHQFMEGLKEDGHDEDDVAVTEVEIIG